MKSITLANGYTLPCLCYGTDIISGYMMDDNPIKQYAKRIAYLSGCLGVGGRERYIKEKGIIRCSREYLKTETPFFDTSGAYDKSEKMLSSVMRKHRDKKVFICTKMSNHDQLNNVSAKDALIKSMKELNVEHIDLFLLHWPVDGTYLKYWKEFEELYEEGMVSAIGVSNCKIHHLKSIEKVARIMPMVNEVELHPLLTETQLRSYCSDKNIQIMAYTSTARLDFRLKNSSRMKNVCDKHNKCLSQIIIRWHIQNGIIPIFNSSSVKHLYQNMDVFDFELDDDDMAIIESMNINSRTRYDSDNCEFENL